MMYVSPTIPADPSVVRSTHAAQKPVSDPLAGVLVEVLLTGQRTTTPPLQCVTSGSDRFIRVAITIDGHDALQILVLERRHVSLNVGLAVYTEPPPSRLPNTE